MQENLKAKQPNKVRTNPRQLGPGGTVSRRPHDIRRAIIERYISRWRKEVGNDIYPLLRLIMPDKDRDRAMYGLKERYLAKYIIKILKIDQHSDDGRSLLKFKQPSRDLAQDSGNFPMRVYQVVSKRPYRTKPGNMTISEVNQLLDELSKVTQEESQVPIIEKFYRLMNPDEFRWLMSIILRHMNVGSTEKTFFNVWHPDAELMYNISSSLKRVAWELWNTNVRLENDRDIRVGQCFQPQLAGYQPRKMDLIIPHMQLMEEDQGFWIEEKLDGERMQMHMQTVQGGKDGPLYKSFQFWSRKAKDYTYLYGSTFDDKESALTQHLRDAFDDNVDSIILDGEMITWDPVTDKMVPFGSLKTAALEQQRNSFSTNPRPLYRVFDVLYMNGKDITRHELRERRNVLERAVKPVDRRLEIHKYYIGKTWEDIETALRKVVAEASEGLVVKNPRSMYKLNDRNDDWQKVKPEYMQEFGESLDCLVIGGYYGSGKRGGGLSSFLCGLRIDDDDGKVPSRKFSSFFKVGGGMTANDYATIRHHTEGKWVNWDNRNPPQDYVIPSEIPDVWIRPEDSVVIQAKAASVGPSDEFGVNLTLRFPRFQKLRGDKDWETALSIRELYDVRDAAEIKKEENKQEVARMKAERRKKNTSVKRRSLQVVGYTQKVINEAMAEFCDASMSTGVFRGLTIYVMTGSDKPEKKSKVQLEEMIKSHGGRIIQTASPKQTPDGKAVKEIICIGRSRTVQVSGLVNAGTFTILKPAWLFDCIAQARIDLDAELSALPLRPELERHFFFVPEDQAEFYEEQTDEYGDSYARDVSTEELRQCINKMSGVSDAYEPDERIVRVVGESPGWLFKNTVIHFVEPANDTSDGGNSAKALEKLQPVHRAQDLVRFAGARLQEDLSNSFITHVVVNDSVAEDGPRMKALRARIAKKNRLPRLVTLGWIEDSWKEKTRLDEERYAPV